MDPIRINNEMNRKKRLPTPTTQERAEAERDGHPGEMKARGAVEEPKKGCGLESGNGMCLQ